MTANSNPRIICSTIVGAVGVLGSVGLIVAKIIGEPSFVVLVCVSILSALAIAFSERIQSVNLRELKLELAKVETARKDVEQREQEIRRIATTLAEVTIFIAAFQKRLGSTETHALEVEWLTQRVSQLLSELHAPEEERQRVFRYLNAVRKMDELRKSESPASEDQWTDIWKTVTDEIEKAKKQLS